MDDENQQESLLHPHHAIEHQLKFNSTPMGFTDANNQSGNPQMIVKCMAMPFLFYGRKMCQHMLNLSKVEITVTLPCNPSSDACMQPQW